jgi:hypothetical protein
MQFTHFAEIPTLVISAIFRLPIKKSLIVIFGDYCDPDQLGLINFA